MTGYDKRLRTEIQAYMGHLHKITAMETITFEDYQKTNRIPFKRE